MRIPTIKTVRAFALTVGVIAVIASIFACSYAAAEDEDKRLTFAEFDQLHQKLTKMSTEKVWSIPWQLSVRKAREMAAEARKPVFLWISSNGGTHPLGPC